MNISQIRTSNYFNKTGGQNRSELAALVNRLQIQSGQRNMDTVTIQSTTINRKENEETSIYKPSFNYMRSFADVSYTREKPDENLQAEILPPSEKSEYTERDALMNQYMKQYRIDAKIEGDSITLFSDQPVRIILPDMISDEELEEYRKSLSEKGLSQEIDWKGVNSDFVNMGVGFDNAERLEIKVDYLASRYAVLKDRIQKQFTGDDQIQQMGILDEIYNNAKDEMADKYARQIGGFYEELGQNGAAEEFKNSILAMVDKKSNTYESYLLENNDYAKINNSENNWLLQDDAYMAAQLRESQSAGEPVVQTTLEQEGYNIDDLTFAGVYAKSLTTQLQNTYQLWSVDQADNALGQFFAKQYADTQEIVSNANINEKIRNMTNSTFRPYIDKFMDELDKVIDRRQEMVNENPWMSQLIRTNHIDRNRVYSSYESALSNLNI